MENIKFKFLSAARGMLIKIKKELYSDKTNLFCERVGDDFPAYLWPFSVTIEAISAYLLTTRGNTDTEITELHRTCLDKILPRYRDSKRNNYRVYNSTTDGGDPFYDDDAWIALEFIRASEMYPENHDEYLRFAIETADYCFSGEDALLGGGIYWKEHDCRTKHTCINGPAAVLACELYNATGEEKYKAKAIELYQFTKKYLLDENGVYNDNVNADTEKIDFAKYTYNSGTMTVAGVMLGKITGETSYTDDAIKCADASLKYFANTENINESQLKTAKLAYMDSPIKCDNPWFCSWLLAGYKEVASLNISDNDNARINSFVTALNTCIENPIDGEFWNPKWTSTVSKKNKTPELIDQSGTVKCLSMLF